jgi:hypothetical protein
MPRRETPSSPVLLVLLAMAAVSLLGLLLLLTRPAERPPSREPERVRLLYAADSGPRAAARWVAKDGLEELRRLSLASAPDGVPLSEREEAVIGGSAPWFSLPKEDGVTAEVARPLLAGAGPDPDSDLRIVNQGGFTEEVHRVLASARGELPGSLSRVSAFLRCGPIAVDVSRLLGSGGRPAQTARFAGLPVLGPPNNLRFFLNDVRRYAEFAALHKGRQLPLEEGDVFDDVFADAPWGGGGVACPDPVGEGGRNCQWRTLVARRLAAAGGGIAAFDVTSAVPRRLWETAEPGLAAAQSTPAFGRVRARSARTGRLEERSVVVFGEGTWLVAADAATGRLLYKTDHGLARAKGGGPVVSRAFGPILAAVAVIDLDGDGFTDTLYFGDGNGRLWRLSLPDGELPGGDGSAGRGAPVLLFDGAPAQPILRPVAVMRAAGRLSGPPGWAVAWLAGGRVSVIHDAPGSSGEPPVAKTGVLLERIEGPAAPSLAGCRAPAGPRAAGWSMDLPADEQPASDLVAVSRYLYFTTRGGREAFYRLSVDTGDACQGADCCAAAGEPWVGGAGRGGGFRRSGADVTATAASVPATYSDAAGAVHVVVAAEVGGIRHLFDTKVPVRSRLYDWSR